MSKFSNTNELNDMIDEFIHKYGSIFQDVVKCAMRDDIQRLVDEAKKEEGRMSMTDNELREYLEWLDWQKGIICFAWSYNSNQEIVHENLQRMLGLEREMVMRWIRGIGTKENENGRRN